MQDNLTIGDLKRQLAGFADDIEIGFSGGLKFYRIKMRGENLAMVEFNEFEAILSSEFKKKFPEVKVAFCSFESDGSILQEVGIPEL